MVNIWKKWLKNVCEMRVVLVLLYGFATFGTPLYHTCQLADKGVDHRYSEYSSPRLHSDEYVKVQSVVVFNQNDITETAKSHNQYCAACLFSLTSKAFKLCPNTSLRSTQAVVRTQVLPQLSFIKQLEWFCSAPLRAPPIIAS